MNLDHSNLEPFEPTISQLLAVGHTSGIWELEKKGFRLPDIEHNSSALRHFIRGCHYGFDLAQRKTAALVIKMEHEIAEAREQLKQLRRSRDIKVKVVLSRIEVLRNRQIVLRRLVDSILYTIIRAESWILRRLTVDLQIHPIDPVVLERTTQLAVERNRENRLRFSVVSDLTTVVQIGDLVEIDMMTPGSRKWAVIELKEGKVNELLSRMIHEKGEALTDEDFELMRQLASDKAPKQAQRMIRQQTRMRELKRFVETDRGIVPALQVEAYITPDSAVLEDFSDVIAKVYELAKEKGIGAGIVDGCVRLLGFATDRVTPPHSARARHQFFHMANPGAACAFMGTENLAEREGETQALKSVPYFVDLADYNMVVPVAAPIFNWEDKRMVLDLVMGRIKIFIQFDLEAFFQLAARENIKMRWIAGKEADAIKKLSMRFPGTADAWGIHAEPPDGPVQMLLAGFICRPFAYFTAPHELLRMVKRTPEQLAKVRDQQ